MNKQIAFLAFDFVSSLNRNCTICVTFETLDIILIPASWIEKLFKFDWEAIKSFIWIHSKLDGKKNYYGNFLKAFMCSRRFSWGFTQHISGFWFIYIRSVGSYIFLWLYPFLSFLFDEKFENRKYAMSLGSFKASKSCGFTWRCVA